MKRRFANLVFALSLSSATLAQTQQTALTVSVVGAVSQPGTYEMRSTGLTLLQVVAMSGGTQATADRTKIQVVRLKQQAAGGDLSETIKVDLDRIRKGKAKDLQLQPGDIISIPFLTKPFLKPIPKALPIPPQKDVAKVEVNKP